MTHLNYLDTTLFHITLPGTNFLHAIKTENNRISLEIHLLLRRCYYGLQRV